MSHVHTAQKAHKVVFHPVPQFHSDVPKKKIETQQHFNHEVKQIFKDGVQHGHSVDHIATQLHTIAQKHPDFAKQIHIPEDMHNIRRILLTSSNSIKDIEKTTGGALYDPTKAGDKKTDGTANKGPHKVDDAAAKLVANFEGYSSKIYNDAAGNPTIGYGHLLKPGEAAKFADGITKEQGLALLKQDMKSAADAVNKNVKVPLTQNQFDALTSFTFNVGAGALEKSTLLKKLNAGDYEAVPTELNKWTHAGGKELPGLVNRRAAEGKLFTTPDTKQKKETQKTEKAHSAKKEKTVSKDKIVKDAKTWIGDKYKYGGNSKTNGVDCSHFVNDVFKEVGIKYPYTPVNGNKGAALDVWKKNGFKVVTGTVHKGDIILFNGHMGIITDPVKKTFIGAQSSTGVAETSYAKGSYWGSSAGDFTIMRNKHVS